MIIKNIVDEDFVNYKVPSMFIITSQCTFKCDRESGIKCCQNSGLVKQPNISIQNESLVKRYYQNPITEAVVFGGLEPMDQFNDVFKIIKYLREDLRCNDDVVIYSGYTETELQDKINALSEFPNIIVKFGRFVPDSQKRFDETLGVYLSSYNQYAKRVSNDN